MKAVQHRGILIELLGHQVSCGHHHTSHPILSLFLKTSYDTRSTKVLYNCYPNDNRQRVNREKKEAEKTQNDRIFFMILRIIKAYNLFTFFSL
jgi:hypothetical protein